jgi:hypothetical protein
MDAVHAEPSPAEAVAKELRGVQVVVYNKHTPVHDVTPNCSDARWQCKAMKNR